MFDPDTTVQLSALLVDLAVAVINGVALVATAVITGLMAASSTTRG
jgi:hypothetical protein